ncbi:MAG: Gfo/Idh/MocA family oxidoreductase [Candidatus Glassbacteria bacterium]|nr:Gfo/Idh/MocA family oxidoreductase [Candidatus Glassbacteria bacterium]
MSGKREITRRKFIAGGAATAIAGFPFIRSAHAQQEETTKVGLIGCGGRGTGAAANAITAAPNIHLTAMADLVPEQIERSLDALKGDRDLQGELQANIKVSKDSKFTGMDCYKKVMESDVDYVILATPPGFRPLHFDAAVRAGKHIFAEKPLATDPAGVRKITKSAETAKSKGLSVVVGLNNRHSIGGMELVKRIHDGGIGEIRAGRIYRLGGGLWHRGSDPSWTEMEYQCRNWYYFCWLSGDQIVEMVIHQIDRMNWLMGSHPVSAVGSGGRQVRTDPKYGNIWDHMSIDYEYPGGVHVSCMLRQWDNCENKVATELVGTTGTLAGRSGIVGANPWRYTGERTNSSVYEHTELIESIRNNHARNDALDFGAESTLTAIMGREAAYTGKLLTWEEMVNSDLDLCPKSMQLGPAPKRPVPIPGKPRPA